MPVRYDLCFAGGARARLSNELCPSAAHGVTDRTAKFCCDCCQMRVVIRPADGKSLTVACLVTPVVDSPAGAVTVNAAI